MTFALRICECIEHEEQGIFLKGIPLVLIACAEYERDFWDWIDWLSANRN